MRNWKLLLSTLLVLCVASSVTAQIQQPVHVPASAIAQNAELTQLLEQGSRLEQAKQWREALSHYEKALRKFPRVTDLKERLLTARAQFDISRRYLDASFITSVKHLDHKRTLDVYSEVLLKMATYYVHTPEWQELYRRGADSLSISVSNPKFGEHHASRKLDVAKVRHFINGERNRYHIRTRHDCRNAVASLAYQLEQHYGIRASATIMEFVCGAVGSLDEYSAFLTTYQLEDVLSQIEGNFVGLGIELKPDADDLLVVNVIRTGPAAAAGLKPQDRIIAVDNKKTKSITPDAAADLLKGVEGSRVTISVKRPDKEIVELTMVRRRIDVPSIEDAKIVDRQAGVAYLRLSSFQKTTKQDITNALWKLHHDGMRSLIVDVRGNPGGLLQAAVDVANKFVGGGTIVSTRGRNLGEDKTHRANPVGTWRMPLVVLIDKDSASASEIFAAAIHDHGRGQVIGETSYGKGSVQGIFPLATAKIGLRLTTAKFYSPSGQPISRRGVVPHVAIRTAAKPVDGQAVNEDVVLKTGVKIAQQMTRER